MYKRIFSLALSSQETCFLWGPRQTGKSTLVQELVRTSFNAGYVTLMSIASSYPLDQWQYAQRD